MLMEQMVMLLVFALAAAVCLQAFAVLCLLSLKIRKISPKTLLTGE